MPSRWSALQGQPLWLTYDLSAQGGSPRVRHGRCQGPPRDLLLLLSYIKHLHFLSLKLSFLLPRPNSYPSVLPCWIISERARVHNILSIPHVLLFISSHWAHPTRSFKVVKERACARITVAVGLIIVINATASGTDNAAHQVGKGSGFRFYGT
jgi:hypothetical protein